jgi:hypothetical protein
MMKSSTSHNESWVHVPSRINQDTELKNHQTRRKQVDELLQMIKDAEKSLKEKKRRNEKFKKELLAEQTNVFQQLAVTD